MVESSEAVSLSGAKVIVDVQHLYRDGIHAGDRGSRFTLPGGVTAWEAQAATTYAAAASSWLRARGATVWTNDPAHSFLVGPYSRRNKFANGLRPDCYIACHVNAGGGDYCATEYMQGAGTAKGLPLGVSVGYEIMKAVPEVSRYKPVSLQRGERGAVCIELVQAPAIVLEPFFGDRLEHQGLFVTDRLVQIGEAVGLGVYKWWHAVHGGPA